MNKISNFVLNSNGSIAYLSRFIGIIMAVSGFSQALDHFGFNIIKNYNLTFFTIILILLVIYLSIELIRINLAKQNNIIPQENQTVFYKV